MSRVFGNLLTLCAGLLLFFAHAGATSVRVRIKKAQDQISITGMNLSFQTDVQKFTVGSLLTSVELRSELRAGVIFWFLTEKATGRLIQNFSGSRVRLAGEVIRVGLTSVPRDLEFSVDRPKKSAMKIDVIASVDLDDYLIGVLPHEMSPDWPLEALKAQAVASRTYALNRIAMRDRQGKTFHMESSVMDQVFNWREPTAVSQMKLKNVRLAVAETRGETLQDGKGRTVAAYFHADCGGHTEEPSQVWGASERKNGTAVDASCPVSAKSRWSWTVTASELVEKVAPKLKLAEGASITEVDVEKISESGRVSKLAMVLSSGERKSMSGNDLRAELGFDKLKSTKFELSRGPEGQFIFTGRGHGHGAGLCQWGSKALAEGGANYRKILAHYYPRAHLKSSN